MERKGLAYWMPISIVIGLCLIGIICLGVNAATIPDLLDDYPEIKGEPIPEEYRNSEELYEEDIDESLNTIQLRHVVVGGPEADSFMTDRDYMAAVVMAEAGSEKFIGKVAVAEVILNRADLFDISIEAVVTAKNQFTYPYTGVITAACYEAVDYALENRDLFPKNMIFFRNQHFHDIGEPYIQIGNHYFSTTSEAEWDMENLGEKD